MNECMDQIPRNTPKPRQIRKGDLHEGDADNIRKQFWLITVQAAWLIKTIHLHPHPIFANFLVTTLTLCQMILAGSPRFRKSFIVSYDRAWKDKKNKTKTKNSLKLLNYCMEFTLVKRPRQGYQCTVWSDSGNFSSLYPKGSWPTFIIYNVNGPNVISCHERVQINEK